MQWADTLAPLRSALALQEWTAENQKGLSVSVNPDRTTAIAVSSADGNTGTDTQPSTKNPKGPATEYVVQMNQGILDFQDGMTIRERPGRDDEIQVWYLLYHVDEKEREIRLELSLPLDMDDNHRVSEWVRRIILDPIKLDPDDGILSSTTDTDISPRGGIDIPVTRRAG